MASRSRIKSGTAGDLVVWPSCSACVSKPLSFAFPAAAERRAGTGEPGFCFLEKCAAASRSRIKSGTAGDLVVWPSCSACVSNEYPSPSRPQRSGEPGPESRVIAVLKDAQRLPGPGSSPGRLVIWLRGPCDPPAYQTHILRLPGRSEAESRDR